MTRSGTTPPASVLQAPSPSFSKLDIRAKEVRPSELVRSGPRSSGEPYFGKLGLHRFDDPSCTYGTCYLDFDLSTALAETLLHDVSAVNGQFVVERSRFNALTLPLFPVVLNPTVVVAGQACADGDMHLRRLGDADANTTMPADAPA
jgi:hypothetical protein